MRSQAHPEGHGVVSRAYGFALEPFSRLQINLSKIESRPSKRKAWEYFFFVDCDGHMSDGKVEKAIKLLNEQCSFVKVLGSYPNSE